MSKKWFNIGCVALAGWLCGCNNEVLIDEVPQQPVAQATAIGFDKGYVDYALLSRAGLSLDEHVSSMGVWGWSTADGAAYELIFKNQVVNYAAPDWTYSPLKYWDAQSSYQFYAYAPHAEGTGVTATIDADSKRISLSGVTLRGDNLQSTPSAEQKKSFKEVNDVDWMVARAGQSASGLSRMKVEFTMQHVLAKLNVRLKASADLLESGNLTAITVNGLTVDKLVAEGDFTQCFNHTPDVTLPQEAAVNEWTLKEPATTVTLQGANGFAATATFQYLLESLVMPQTVAADSKVQLHYTFAFSDGRTENFVYTMGLDEAFDRLVSGSNYTISFVIDPECIRFDAGVDNWTEYNEIKGID